jgi:hypothetical protein
LECHAEKHATRESGMKRASERPGVATCSGGRLHRALREERPEAESAAPSGAV